MNGHLRWTDPNHIQHFTKAMYAEHMAGEPKMINFILFGWLSVTATAVPAVIMTKQAETPTNTRHYHLGWRVRATCHSPRRGDDLGVSIPEVYTTINTGEVKWYMKAAARTAARAYVNSGRVRGNSYVRWPIHALINSKDKLRLNQGEYKRWLKMLRMGGYLGKPEEQGAAWLR